MPGAAKTISKIRKMGFEIVFVTNNSGKSRENIADKLKRMDINTDSADVLNSGYASGLLLNMLRKNGDASALVIGTEDLKDDIRGFGIKVVDNAACDYVVIGLDPEFNYKKIADGLEALNNGARMIACNRDRYYPVEGGAILPGCGSMVAAVECAWGGTAHYEVGKPATMLLKMITEYKKVKPEEILVVGDSMESDIAMAKAYGSPAVLITGSSGYSDQAIEESIVILNSLSELPLILKQMLAR
jgi:HAD superfamily hydrolase (TIGR01450 family)